MKILVIDDSATIRKIVVHTIRKSPVVRDHQPEIEILEACDGREGLEQVEKHGDTALVLCDMHMPNMDGLEFVRALRARAEQLRHAGERSGCEPRVLMITAETGPEVVRQALDAGADDYLKKPFTKEELAEKLASLLG